MEPQILKFKRHSASRCPRRTATAALAKPRTHRAAGAVPPRRRRRTDRLESISWRAGSPRSWLSCGKRRPAHRGGPRRPRGDPDRAGAASLENASSPHETYIQVAGEGLLHRDRSVPRSDPERLQSLSRRPQSMTCAQAFMIQASHTASMANGHAMSWRGAAGPLAADGAATARRRRPLPLVHEFLALDAGGPASGRDGRDQRAGSGTGCIVGGRGPDHGSRPRGPRGSPQTGSYGRRRGGVPAPLWRAPSRILLRLRSETVPVRDLAARGNSTGKSFPISLGRADCSRGGRVCPKIARTSCA